MAQHVEVPMLKNEDEYAEFILQNDRACIGFFEYKQHDFTHQKAEFERIAAEHPQIPFRIFDAKHNLFAILQLNFHIPKVPAAVTFWQQTVEVQPFDLSDHVGLKESLGRLETKHN